MFLSSISIKLSEIAETPSVRKWPEPQAKSMTLGNAGVLEDKYLSSGREFHTNRVMGTGVKNCPAYCLNP